MKLLYIYLHRRSFVDIDIDLLSKSYDVTPFEFKFSKIFELIKELRKCDCVFSFFASYHTFACSLLSRKPLAVVVGGYDASDIPGFGMFTNPWRQFIIRTIYKRAKHILPVDESLSEVICEYMPHVKDKITVVPTGYDCDKYRPKGKKKKQVLTVHYVNEINWWRKGLSTLCDVAQKMPDVEFYVAGKVEKDIEERICNLVTFIPNIHFLDFVSDERLVELYQESEVFVLLSKHEGLPNVLCEAMLCGCFPVTTGVNGIPNAQKDKGLYVRYGDVKQTSICIRKALNRNVNESELRDIIIKKFSLRHRENAFNKLFKEE